jgi:hypothetical protein
MEESSLARLAHYFETSPAARRAVAPLAEGAGVALDLDEGPARFTRRRAGAQVEAGAAVDPDFTLRLPAAAVERLTSNQTADVGEVGVAFFQLVLERDPALKVRVTVGAPVQRLVRHGYLAVLAQGGARVALWLIRRGVADPRRVIERLRKR